MREGVTVPAPPVHDKLPLDDVADKLMDKILLQVSIVLEAVA